MFLENLRSGFVFKLAVDIDKLLSKMDQKDKIELLTGIDDVYTKNMPKYKIESKSMVDGPHGVRLDFDKNCTHFPNLCSLAATWDKNAARLMGEALGEECKKHEIDMLLAPGVNIKRTPLCGRNFEYFSEDPVLAGELCAEYVNGVQSKGIGTSVKHYAANNQEKYRQTLSVDIDERTLRELYLKAFEIVIKKAQPMSVMCSYNKINSVWCSENPYILTEVLKDDWGFDGFTVSDWGAIHDSVKALKAGLDMQMPPEDFNLKAITDAVNSREIPIDRLDDAVKRILRFLLIKRPQSINYNREKQHNIAREIAAAGVVLLKNDNNVLPLTSKKYKNIAVVGEMAVKPLISGQGSAEVYNKPEYIDSPLEELKKLLPEVNFEYCEFFKKSSFSEKMLWPKACSGEMNEFVKRSDIVLLFVGSMTSEDTEKVDRRTIEMNQNYDMVLEFLLEHGKPVVVILQNGGAVMLNQPKVSASAIVEMWLAGESGGGAVADVLCGVVNPSGRLPETFPTKLRTDMEYPGNGRYVTYNEKLDVGYRYYDKHTNEICYPFGHGLSYTDFSYTNPVITESDDKFTLKFNLKNTGEYDGSEVVQVYVSDTVATLPKPVKELKKFEKIFLKRGETKEVSFELTKDDFSYFNISLHKWVAENGKYKILIGASSQDIRLETEINYQNDKTYSTVRLGHDKMGDNINCFK